MIKELWVEKAFLMIRIGAMVIFRSSKLGKWRVNLFA